MLACKIAYWTVAALLLWCGLRAFERANLYFPLKTHYALPGAYGFPFEQAYFSAADGTRLNGWFVDARLPDTKAGALNEPYLPPTGKIPPDSSGPRAVIFFHGNGGNISHRLQKLRLLRGLGLSVWLFDYRGYGKSEGRPSERGTYLDAEAAVGFLKTKRLDFRRAVYYGESLGCAVALETALKFPPAALILESPFTSTVEMGKEVFPFLPVSWMVRYRYDNLAKIGRLAAPLLVLHSGEDDIVPFGMGRRLYEAAPEPKAFVRTRGDHNEGFLQTESFGKHIEDFLRSELK